MKTSSTSIPMNIINLQTDNIHYITIDIDKAKSKLLSEEGIYNIVNNEEGGFIRRQEIPNELNYSNNIINLDAANSNSVYSANSVNTDNLTDKLNENKTKNIKLSNNIYIGKLHKNTSLYYGGLNFDTFNREGFGLNKYDNHDVYFGNWENNKRIGSGLYLFSNKNTPNSNNNMGNNTGNLTNTYNSTSNNLVRRSIKDSNNTNNPNNPNSSIISEIFHGEFNITRKNKGIYIWNNNSYLNSFDKSSFEIYIGEFYKNTNLYSSGVYITKEDALFYLYSGKIQ